MALNFSKGGKLGKYFYLDERGVDYGPFEISELLEVIDKDTLVYYKGINWTKASEVPELKRYFHEEIKVVEKIIEKESVKSTTPKKSPILLIFIVFFIVGSLLTFLFYLYLDSQNDEEQTQLEQQRLADSIALVNSKLMMEMEKDSMNDVINARIDSLNAVQSELLFLQNQDYLIERVDSYFVDIVSNNFDAYNYYSDSVDQFINLINVSPEDVNNVFTSPRDYTDEQIYFDKNTFAFDKKIGNVYYFTFSIQYRCFRIKRNKTQECDVDIQIGFDENFQIKSYKELKIRNLVFN
ncbi:MAG: DUF4339 domain-containing protein [Bacteroidota bacterium]